ncbi:MAG: hypothetical protein QF444_04705, partial [Phycisphaerales bacterium]|nr:hypothetical protein [Phycisphaerales bacterium]
MWRLLLLGLTILTACDSGFRAIDHRVEEIMAQTNESIGSDVVTPQTIVWNDLTESSPDDPLPHTENPPMADLVFVPAKEVDSDAIGKKLDRAATDFETSGTTLSLEDSLS